MLLRNIGRTNCITEIPQDIKLELADGTLTLKAGSRVYVPNGVNKFDVITTTSNLTITYTNTDTLFIYLAKGGNTLTLSSVVTTVSGATDSLAGKTYHNWYDTTNNVIHRYTNNASTPNFDCSFPLCIAKTSADGIISIDQVFNGFGYIGHSLYMLPNVKFLCSDGFNSDGTYKNTEYIVPSVKVKTHTYNIPNAVLFSDGGSIGLTITSQIYEVENTLPTPASSYERVYVRSENQWYYHIAGETSWLKLNGMCVLGKGDFDGGKGVTSLTPNKVKTTYDYKPCMLHRKIKKYYKYQDWTQPILTSNGTLGGDSFACSQSTYLNDAMAFRCFNGDTTTEGESNRWQINSVNTSTQYWISWYNPKPLKTSSIKVYNNQATYVVKNWELCGSDDNVNWTTLATGTNTNTTAFSSWTISVPSSAKAYKYFSLGCTPNSTTSMQIGEIQITAKEVVNGTSSNYDYYETETKPYLFARGKRKYYKYEYTNWTQPTMTSDTTYGTLTASVVNSGSGVYQAFDKNTSSWWEAMKGTAEWLNWKLPVTLKITGIKIRVRTGNRPNITCRCYTDSSKKTPIGDSITTTTAGQEIAVANIPSSGIITNNIYFDCSSTQDYMGILEITITAQEQSSVESTIDDYDYYKYESFKLY